MADDYQVKTETFQFLKRYDGRLPGLFLILLREPILVQKLFGGAADPPTGLNTNGQVLFGEGGS